MLAALLGVVEGLTEFIPVSSTGHLILLVDLLDFEGPPGKVFEIVIQLGAILAVCWAYRAKLLRVAAGLPHDPSARHFAIVVLLAFLPAALVGALAHGFIKTVLFSPYVVSTSLILGGLAIIAIERAVLVPRVRDIDGLRPRTAFLIGAAQTVAMIPGVSRSGATIMGGLLLRVDRKAATEFSFFLAIPTMLGATTLDIYKNAAVINTNDALVIMIGFAAAFLAALAVVRVVVTFVGRHGFTPFGWYRIAVGTAMLATLAAR
jgi:undecaprenyl-diphosphatase